MLETTGLAFRSLSTDSAADIWLIRRENMDFVTNAVDALQARVLVQYTPDSGLPFVDGGGVVLPTNFAASRTTEVVAWLFRNPPPRSPPSALPPRSERHPPHSHASRDPAPQPPKRPTEKPPSRKTHPGISGNFLSNESCYLATVLLLRSIGRGHPSKTAARAPIRAPESDGPRPQ